MGPRALPRATVSAAAPEPTLRAFVVPDVRPTPPAAQPEPPREIVNAAIEDFLVRPPNSIGTIWFDGEVRNLSPHSQAFKVLVKAYSINQVLLDSKEFYVGHGDPIPPGERAHFNDNVKSSTGQEIYRVIPEIVVR